MKRTIGSTLVGLVVGMLALGGVSYAATGGSFILGRSNSATTTTALTNSAGSALALASKTGTAPFTVNQTTKVPRLNSDLIDGLDSSLLALKAGRTGTIQGQSAMLDLNDDGLYDAIGGIADCPAGTYVTGGGHEIYTTWGAIVAHRAENGYFFVTLTDSGSTASDLVPYVQCYNPRGAVVGDADPVGGMSTASHRSVQAEMLSHLDSKMKSHLLKLRLLRN